MTRSGIAFFVVVASAAFAGACDPKGGAGADAGAQIGPTAVTTAPPASARASASAAPRAHVSPPPRVPCRAVSVEGDVRAEGAAFDAGTRELAAEGQVPEDTWIALGRGARFVAKDPRTTRETIFYGPGRARACAGHREESWIAAGTFESERGAGETPGAEEWVVTPDAVVRFAAAKLRAKVGPRDTTVNVANGVALVWTPADARATIATDAGTAPKDAADDPWQRAAEGTVHVVSLATKSPTDAARSALDACSAIAHHSEELTRALLAPHEGAPDGRDAGSLGSTEGRAIAEQVSTRELARATCAVAALRVAALAPSVPRADLDERLGEAERAWTALPVASLPPVH